MSERDLCAFEELIGYRFKDKELLKQALTHTSYSNETHEGHLGSNERLEFLGDAVLELISSDYFYYKYPEYEEGKLTRIRASFVCEHTLAECAEHICLPDYLYLGKGEEATGGRYRASITSDAMEAVIGAMYLDGSLEDAKSFIYRSILKYADDDDIFHDSKTALQELVQRLYSETPVYNLVSEDGPDHDKVFTSEVVVAGEIMGSGKGSSKKVAEQTAAKEALLRIKNKT